MKRKNRKRDIPVMFWTSEAEMKLIKEKIHQCGMVNLSSYMRKMAIDGYVIKLELPELKELLFLLRKSSNNLNQIAHRINQTGRIYQEDIEEINLCQDKIWKEMNSIITKLAQIT